MKIQTILITLLSSVAFNAFGVEAPADPKDCWYKCDMTDIDEIWHKERMEKRRQWEAEWRERRKGMHFESKIPVKPKYTNCVKDFYDRMAPVVGEFHYTYGVQVYQTEIDRVCFFKLSKEEACDFLDELKGIGNSHYSNDEYCRFSADSKLLLEKYKEVIYSPDFQYYEAEYSQALKTIYRVHAENTHKILEQNKDKLF